MTNLNEYFEVTHCKKGCPYFKNKCIAKEGKEVCPYEENYSEEPYSWKYEQVFIPKRRR